MIRISIETRQKGRGYSVSLSDCTFLFWCRSMKLVRRFLAECDGRPENAVIKIARSYADEAKRTGNGQAPRRLSNPRQIVLNLVKKELSTDLERRRDDDVLEKIVRELPIKAVNKILRLDTYDKTTCEDVLSEPEHILDKL